MVCGGAVSQQPVGACRFENMLCTGLLKLAEARVESMLLLNLTTHHTSQSRLRLCLAELQYNNYADLLLVQ
jgi:hypothetical protein